MVTLPPVSPYQIHPSLRMCEGKYCFLFDNLQDLTRGSCLRPEVDRTGWDSDLEDLEAEMVGQVCVYPEKMLCVCSESRWATFPRECAVPQSFTIIHSRVVWWETSPARLTSLCISLDRNLFLGFMEL